MDVCMHATLTHFSHTAGQLAIYFTLTAHAIKCGSFATTDIGGCVVQSESVMNTVLYCAELFVQILK